jgi:hypothetical protein
MRPSSSQIQASADADGSSAEMIVRSATAIHLTACVAA